MAINDWDAPDDAEGHPSMFSHLEGNLSGSMSNIDTCKIQCLPELYKVCVIYTFDGTE